MEAGGDVMEAGKTGSQELNRGYNIDEGRAKSAIYSGYTPKGHKIKAGQLES